MKPQPTTASPWVDGIGRHLDDLQHDWYEGASGAERHGRYVAAFELLTPVARDVLQQFNAALLHSTGEISVRAPESDGAGGWIGSWLLNWRHLSEARNRMTGTALAPVTISAIFPAGFTHPHLVAGRVVDPRAASISAWPMQVTSADDAARQRPLLWAIATAEVHDRIYQ